MTQRGERRLTAVATSGLAASQLRVAAAQPSLFPDRRDAGHDSTQLALQPRRRRGASRSENQPPAPGACQFPRCTPRCASSGGASLLRRRVVAHGLVARADLNEKTGVVTAWDGLRSGTAVFFDEISQPLAIKAANLTDVGRPFQPQAGRPGRGQDRRPRPPTPRSPRAATAANAAAAAAAATARPRRPRGRRRRWRLRRRAARRRRWRRRRQQRADVMRHPGGQKGGDKLTLMLPSSLGPPVTIPATRSRAPRCASSSPPPPSAARRADAGAGAQKAAAAAAARAARRAAASGRSERIAGEQAAAAAAASGWRRSSWRRSSGGAGGR